MGPWARKIKIGSSLFLTDTGLTGGTKLLTEVEGIDQLRTTHTGDVIVAISGKPHAFVLSNTGAGVLLSITAERITQSLYNSIKSEINTAMSTAALLRIIFSDGPEGTLTVDCRCGQPGVEPMEYGSFIGTSLIYTDAKFNFTVDAII